jgi:8-oxo-dGTP pyrophosphatase MutT (NUDIX family)
MINLNLIIFLIKLVIVVLTLLSALFVRVDAFVVSRGVGNKALVSTCRVCFHSPQVISRQTSKMSATITSSSTIKTKELYTPSQVVIDEETGEKWRLCAGVAVLNSRNELLMAERLDRPGSWQCPQGGVDDVIVVADEDGGTVCKDNISPPTKETIVDAAIRELFEETGLVVGQHVMLDPTFPIPSSEAGTGVRYSTHGTATTGNNWLTQAGFSGQELHWTVFRCMSGRGDWDPSSMCDLSGQGNSKAEFSDVAWRTARQAVQGVWEGKRAPYQFLESLIEQYGSQWLSQMSQLDFSGTWERNLSESTYVIPGLQARGLSLEDARKEAEKPYIQHWESLDDSSSLSWTVTTFADDGETPRRTLEYSPGTWTETYQGKAILFGESVEPVTLKRQTSYVAELDATPIPMAQVTITDGPHGFEESRRYLKDGKFLLRRTLWPNATPKDSIVSTEVFTQRS